MKEIRWRWSSEQTPWAERQGCSADLSADAQLCLNGQQYQKMYGFGACFNELGWRALNVLSEADSDELLEELFSPARDGAKLDLCRLPIGGNDYSLDWYSLDEVPGDYELAHFSIARDKQTLIPYIKRALAHTDQLKLLASPWSPPTWMKASIATNFVKLKLKKMRLFRLICEICQGLCRGGHPHRSGAFAKRAGRRSEISFLHVDGQRNAGFHPGLLGSGFSQGGAGYRAMAGHHQCAQMQLSATAIRHKGHGGI